MAQSRKLSTEYCIDQKAKTQSFLLRCLKNLHKTYPKDKSNLRLSVNLGSDMDQKGKIRWIKVPYISAPEALNSVKGIGHFGLKPPKFGGHGTRAPWGYAGVLRFHIRVT